MRVELYKGILTDPNCYPASTLIETFKEYKVTEGFWAFGRDVPYNRPPKMLDYRVSHIHLLTCKQYRDDQAKKKRLYDRTSDKHLIYARSPIDDDFYLLIAIVNPDAHLTAENTQFMYRLYDICKSHFG